MCREKPSAAYCGRTLCFFSLFCGYMRILFSGFLYADSCVVSAPFLSLIMFRTLFFWHPSWMWKAQLVISFVGTQPTTGFTSAQTIHGLQLAWAPGCQCSR
ncbi:hypothetical protein CPC08DRAFT_713179 [Agrocybe pediades]|nr:hypothetical protein CPC08DRAFT_713179 [Agrocybe pediades]